MNLLWRVCCKLTIWSRGESVIFPASASTCRGGCWIKKVRIKVDSRYLFLIPGVWLITSMTFPGYQPFPEHSVTQEENFFLFEDNVTWGWLSSRALARQWPQQSEPLLLGTCGKSIFLKPMWIETKTWPRTFGQMKQAHKIRWLKTRRRSPLQCTVWLTNHFGPSWIIWLC